MALMETPEAQLGMKAPDFALLGVDGKIHSLNSIQRDKGFVVAFICNHCPYVKAIIAQLAQDARMLQDEGIGFVAISANDPTDYPDDSFENMKQFANQHNFSFPYLIDETQDVAEAYGAICTPDFFGFNAMGELQYRGRLDASRREIVPNAERELVNAMRQIAKTGKGPAKQLSSMGCSIKWREDKAA